jgi:type I restriction enzyme S subunit
MIEQALEIDILKNLSLDMHQGINTVTENVEYLESGIPILQSKHITKGFLNLEDTKYLSEKDYLKYKDKYQANIDDVLVCNIGTIGKSLRIDKAEKFLIAWNLFLIKLDNKKLYSQYFAHYLNHLSDQNYFDKFLTGGTVKFINKKTMGNIQVPLPLLKQQQKIANILDAADALRQNDKALIAKYDELTQALFLDMFGDPYLNINNWQEKTCGEFIYYLADIGSNGANSVVSEKLVMTDTEDYALMIRTTNLTRNDFSNNIKYVSKEVYDFFKKSQIFGGEIIMNKIGSAGDFWLMPHLNRPVSLGLNQFVIRLKDINTLYFYYFLSTDYGTKNIKSRINGVATKSITKTAVRELPILFPPIELQNQFAERVAVIEEQKAIAQKSLEKSEELFNSLLQKAFKGQLV